MKSLIIHPYISIPTEHKLEFDELKQSLSAYSKTRNQYKMHFLLEQGFEDDESVVDSVKRGLLNKLCKEETIQQLDSAVDEIMDRLQVVTVLPSHQLNLPVIGHDPSADKYLEEKYASMQRRLDELDEQLRKYWNRSFNEIFEEMKGIAVLELVSTQQALPLFMNEPMLECQDNPLALNMDKILEAIPELGHIFRLGRKAMLLGDELDTLRSSILHEYPDFEIAQQIADYLDFWTTLGHDFIIKMVD